MPAVAKRWQRDEVVPVYDAMQADPGRGIRAEDAIAALRCHQGHYRTIPCLGSGGISG